MLTKEELSQWRQRIDASRTRRQKHESLWACYARLHTNAYLAMQDQNEDKLVMLPNGDQVKVSLVFENIEQTRALLEVPEIGIRATATDFAREIGFEDTHRESVVEQALYGSMCYSGIIKEAEEADFVKLDGIVIGHGINFTYWRVEEEEVELDPIPVLTADETGNLVPLVSDGAAVHERPTEKRIVWEGCQDECISPLQFLTDASCKRLHTSPWHGFEKPTKLDALRKDPRYNIPADIKGTSFIVKDIYAEESDKGEEITDAVMVIVIWDKLTKRLITFVETCSHEAGGAFASPSGWGGSRNTRPESDLIPISVMRWPVTFCHPDDSPFSFYVPIPARDHPFGISQVEHIRVQALEADKLRTRQANITRQIKRIPWFNKSRVDIDQVRKAFRSTDIEPVGLDIHENEKPEQLFGELPVPSISPDIYRQSELAARGVDKTSGISAVPGGGADTATEADHIFEVGAARPKRKKRIYMSFLTSVAKRHKDYLKQFCPEGEVIVVPDMDGRLLTLAYGRKAFEGNLDIECTPGGGAMTLSPVKQKMILELNASLWGKFGMRCDLALLRRTLTMFDFPGVNEIMRAASGAMATPGMLPGAGAPGAPPGPAQSLENYSGPQTLRSGINAAYE